MDLHLLLAITTTILKQWQEFSEKFSWNLKLKLCFPFSISSISSFYNLYMLEKYCGIWFVNQDIFNKTLLLPI